MKRQKCRICGKLRLTEEQVDQWICSACRQKVGELLKNPDSQPKKACLNCRTLKKGACPFTERERQRITYCTRFEHKDAEHNKKRWEKYGF